MSCGGEIRGAIGKREWRRRVIGLEDRVGAIRIFKIRVRELTGGVICE